MKEIYLGREILSIMIKDNDFTTTEQVTDEPTTTLDQDFEKVKKVAKSPKSQTSSTELIICDIFRRILEQTEVNSTDNFFDLGGDSMSELELLDLLETYFNKKIPLATLQENPTPEALAKALEEQQWQPTPSLLLPIQPEGDQKPLFCFTGLWGFPTAYRRLGELIKDTGHPLYAMGNPDADTVEAIAEICLEDIFKVQPVGPYNLIGYSFGGLVAVEVAKRLQDQGQEVGQILLLDPSKFTDVPSQNNFLSMLSHELKQAKLKFQQKQSLKDHPVKEVIMRNLRALEKYQRPKVNAKATFIVTQERLEEQPDYQEKWLSLFNPDSEVIILNLGHLLLDEPEVKQVATEVKKCLVKARKN